MKMNYIVFAVPLLALALASPSVVAQDHPDNDRHDQAQSGDRHDNGTYRRHDEWKKGSRVGNDDWGRGDKLDYRQNHLSRPPSGHEWRQIDGNYVLANPDGVIFSIRPAPRNHQKSRDEHPR
jgi:Ni/Co efflux regulator RcnB